MANEKQLKREQLHQELEQVRKLSKDGRLHAEDAVEWAKANPDSALHSQIEWDDAKAAESYRIDQVRQLIRVIVYREPATSEKVRAYLSLPSDRVHEGGYRPAVEALAKARQELVAEALGKIEKLRVSYTHLPELSPLFDEIEHAARRYREMPAAKAG